ncbi:MAG TPA: hypothetical protein VME17_14620 [Bryobacteraceae bacterium]|nr:hypothetical protein [Bryobacteraceae bacterium]
MASVKTVERQIGNLEGFDVRFYHPDGSDVRSDKGNIPSYSFARAAKGSMNVSSWRDQRFKQSYPGFDCEILDADGNTCHGAMLLSTVRDTYTE